MVDEQLENQIFEQSLRKDMDSVDVPMSNNERHAKEQEDRVFTDSLNMPERRHAEMTAQLVSCLTIDQRTEEGQGTPKGDVHLQISVEPN